jgi:23S rRNA (pseudouridine1915-N3)-methyltransferase
MFINIVIPARLSGSLYSKLYKIFIERINMYIGCNLIDFKSRFTGDKQVVLLNQANKMLELSSNSYRVALDSGGYLYTTEAFFRWLNDKIEREKTLFFLVGAAFGLHDVVKKNSRELISMTKLTLAHELALLILLEQIYRALTILNNHPYNK